MDCSDIDGDTLDEIVLGRTNDPEIMSHIEGCGDCSRQLAARRELIGDLRSALRRGDSEPRESDRRNDLCNEGEG